MISKSDIAAALRGMFSLRPNSENEKRMIANLAQLKHVSADVASTNEGFESVMKRVTEAMK